MTLVVLALDALDAGLVDRFDLDAYRLETRGDLETYAGKLDLPYTLEVWTTVATGLHADEHGVTRGGTSEWNNPLLEAASRMTGLLSERRRNQLGTLVQERFGAENSLGRTDAETVFDPPGRIVHNWPGVTDGRDLQRIWDLLKRTTGGELSAAAFEREALGVAAEQFGWMREMLNHEVSVAGVHVHTLDATGHAYADDEERLRHFYTRIAGFVDGIVDALGPDDDLLLLSDHGMRTPYLDPGERSGEHSWRAFVASTTDTVPESVFRVREWIDNHAAAVTDPGERVDLPEDHLRELGYLE